MSDKRDDVLAKAMRRCHIIDNARGALHTVIGKNMASKAWRLKNKKAIEKVLRRLSTSDSDIDIDHLCDRVNDRFMEKIVADEDVRDHMKNCLASVMQCQENK